MKLNWQTLPHYVISVTLSIFFLSMAFVVAPTPDAGAASPQQLACEGSGARWAEGKCQDNAANGPSLPTTVKGAINILLFIVGVTAVIVIVVEALRFVNSNGDTQAVAKSKNGIIFALIGLAVAALAYALVNFVLDQL